VRLWKVRGRREVDRHTFSTVVQHVALSLDGRQLAVARDTVVELRPIESKSAIAQVECASRPLDLCFSYGKRLLIVTHTRENSVWVSAMPNPAFD
jgi:undecaprenyl pyrophosphate synthase